MDAHKKSARESSHAVYVYMLYFSHTHKQTHTQIMRRTKVGERAKEGGFWVVHLIVCQ